MIIAIDGTAASGKSTVAALLAQSLGYLYFDTGVMYRAVTWAVLDRKIEVENVNQVSHLAETLLIEVKPYQDNDPDDGRQYTVLADGQDVTWDIRSAAVEKDVSRVSAYPRVRTALTNQQRRLAAAGSIVMVGRDIGTVVLPQADLKFFLRASPEEQARRRYRDCLAQGQDTSFDEILAGILERDKQDRENPIAPMIPANDAIIVDTDDLRIEEVLARLEEVVMGRTEAPAGL